MWPREPESDVSMTCPSNPAPPAGYRILRGHVVQPLTDWAISILRQIRDYPFGATFELTYGGVTYVARVDHHTWTYRGGQLVTGLCIPGVTLYEPRPAGDAATLDSLETPDPTAAVYGDVGDDAIDWKLVGTSALAIGVVVGLFWWGLKAVGR